MRKRTLKRRLDRIEQEVKRLRQAQDPKHRRVAEMHAHIDNLEKRFKGLAEKVHSSS